MAAISIRIANKVPYVRQPEPSVLDRPSVALWGMLRRSGTVPAATTGTGAAEGCSGMRVAISKIGYGEGDALTWIAVVADVGAITAKPATNKTESRAGDMVFLTAK